MGLDYSLVSLRHPTDNKTHPVNHEIRAPINYLPEYLYQEPWRLLRAWRAVRTGDGYKKALDIWLRDLRRDPSPNRVRRFGQAIVLAHELPADVSMLYAHFLHTPASVARYAAKIRTIKWSCSAHAKDIWTSPDWEKTEKLDDLEWLVTCTAANSEHLKQLANNNPEKIKLLYHGLDFNRFPRTNRRYSPSNGSTSHAPVRLLSVGRAVEKKGYDVLIEALASLPADLNWELVHVGGGALSADLKKRANACNLSTRIKWLGALPQKEVLREYQRSDGFVLASRVARDGDRDGLPNVLMEAQSQGVACVSTSVSAVPELIHHGETGLLVVPGDVPALGQALIRLITEPQLRERLGRAGEKRVRQAFEHKNNLRVLADNFDLPMAAVSS